VNRIKESLLFIAVISGTVYLLEGNPESSLAHTIRIISLISLVISLIVSAIFLYFDLEHRSKP